MAIQQGDPGGDDRTPAWRPRSAGFAGGNRYHFDRFGGHLGHLDALGRYFDNQGAFRGWLSPTGTVHAEGGAYLGRIDVIGQFWNARGAAHGYFLGAGPAHSFTPTQQR